MGNLRKKLSQRKDIQKYLSAGLEEEAEQRMQKLLASKRGAIINDLICLLQSSPYKAVFWHKKDDDHIAAPTYPCGIPPVKYLVVSEYGDMPKVLDTLGLIPTCDDYIIMLDPRIFTQKNAPNIDKCYSDFIDAEGIVLLDERLDTGAPISTEPGSVKKVYGHFYDHVQANISYYGDIIDEELAWSLLKQQLVFVCKHAYSDLVPVKKGAGKGKKKSYKMQAVGRCCEFAHLLMCGHIDYSEFAKRPARKKDEAGALRNVRIPRELYPKSLHETYDKVNMLPDVVALWKFAASYDKKVFDFSYEDIDKGCAEERLDKIGEMIGIESFIEACEAGVPVEDITT